LGEGRRGLPANKVWRATFFLEAVVQGIGTSELVDLRQLDEENRELRKLVADLSLDKLALEDALSKTL
jgi:putative transposase